MAQLLTAAEAATYLNASPKALARWRKDLVGPAYIKPAGTHVRYKLEDLDAWIEENACNPGQEN